MNFNERELIRYVCEGDIRSAQKAAAIVLKAITTQKDKDFCERGLRLLNSKGPTLIELPYNLRDKLSAEDVSAFPVDRFLLRPSEAEVVDKVLNARRAASRLNELGMRYLPAAILYGDSGTGKTMLARYIAYRAGLPFVYIRFSGLVSSYLGGTAERINNIFDYVRSNPCVLCLDEIDYIGMKRGQKDEVGEMNRIVVALMQELDVTGNNCILVGTTNRFDRLDPALIRRFPIQEEVLPLGEADAHTLAQMFLSSVNMLPDDDELCEIVSAVESKHSDSEPEMRSYTPDAITTACNQYVVRRVLSEGEDGSND